MAIKERISYVIPVAFTHDPSGTPVLVYEFDEWNGEADISFGVFFIGLRAEKEYLVTIDVVSEDGGETLVDVNSNIFNNKRLVRVSKAHDGESIVSASIKVNFNNVKVNKHGIFQVRASLTDIGLQKVISIANSFFDIKPAGIIRDEFRQ